MEFDANWHCVLIILVFALGYTAIILEHYIKVHKSAVALLIAVICWAIYLGLRRFHRARD